MDTRQVMPRKKNKHVYEDGEESSLFNLFDDFENTEPTDNSKRHEVKDIEGELSCEEIVREQKKAKHNNDIIIDASEKMFTILHHPINGRNIKSLGDLQTRLSKFFDLNYEPTKLNSLKVCKSSSVFKNCVCKFEDNLDIMTTDYTCDVTDEEMKTASSVVAEQIMNYGVVIVDLV